MLLIDSHEPVDIVQALKAKLPVKVLMLKYGDYSFSDAIIERKTLSDFFLSLKNQRLEYQMESISRLYTHKYLVIEGFFDFSYVNNVSYLYSRLSNITLDFDIKIIFSQDINQTICMVKRIYSLKNVGYVLNISRKDKAYHAAKFLE